MNRMKISVMLSILMIISTTAPVLAGNVLTGNDSKTTENMATEISENNSFATTDNLSSNKTETENITPGNISSTSTPNITAITGEEKTKVTNIAINFTVNFIQNPTVVSIEREKEKRDNLLVTVKDVDSGENIVVVVSPNGDVKEQTENVQRFTESVNNFIGKHVSFQLVQNTIINYNIEGRLVFQSINLGFNPVNIKRVGSELRLSDNAKHMVIIHDNDNGIITERAPDNIKAIYKVASGIDIKGKGSRVDFSNNIKASILSNDPDSDKVISSVSSDTIIVTIKNGKSTFISKSIKGGGFDDDLVEGISTNKIGGIINIDADDSFDVNSFNVDVTVNKIVKNRVDVNVDSDTPNGKVVAFSVNKDILANLNPRIFVDGDEIKPAIDSNDLFKIDKLSYLIVIGQNVEILVSIPKFSTHQITISTEGPTITGTTEETISPQETINSETTATPIPAATPSVPGFSGFLTGLILLTLAKLYSLREDNKKR